MPNQAQDPVAVPPEWESSNFKLAFETFHEAAGPESLWRVRLSLGVPERPSMTVTRYYADGAEVEKLIERCRQNRFRQILEIKRYAALPEQSPAPEASPGAGPTPAE